MSPHVRTSVVLVCSLLAATAATTVIYRVVAGRPARAVPVATRPVVVAARPLPLGTRLSEADVHVVQWPDQSVVDGSVTRVEEVLDRGLLSAVLANEPITASRLAAREAGAGLPPTIPEGWRAISVKVNEVIGVAGFILPGHWVDVIVALRGAGAQETPVSRVVVSGVQVLAAGTRYDASEMRDGAPVPASVVTLLVTPTDSERIALAATEGQITLTLRNPLDTAPTTTAGVRLSALVREAHVAAPDPPPPPRRTPRAVVRVADAVPAADLRARAYTVETIRAARRAEEVVR